MWDLGGFPLESSSVTSSCLGYSWWYWFLVKYLIYDKKVMNSLAGFWIDFCIFTASSFNSSHYISGKTLNEFMSRSFRNSWAYFCLIFGEIIGLIFDSCLGNCCFHFGWLVVSSNALFSSSWVVILNLFGYFYHISLSHCRI